MAADLFTLDLVLLTGHPIPHPFFKVPKEGKLSENKTIDQKDYIIDRQDKNVIQNSKQGLIVFCPTDPGNHWIFQKHDCKSCAGKSDQNQDDLSQAI